MKQLLLAFLFCIAGQFAFGQTHTITGVVGDSTGTSLEGAIVLLKSKKDTSKVIGTAANSSGQFSLKNVTDGAYILKITYIGYQEYSKQIIVTNKQKDIALDPIRMSASKELKGVTIKANAVEVEIKKDTLQYNAAAYKTRNNAAVEDLLKKMPGIEVQSDGSIQAQGKTVKNIYVDGKKFFQGDPQAATKNLPAEAVDKIQVFDKKSDVAEFTGIDDGSRETSINIKLKPKFKNGTFGYGTAGYGTDDRFDLRTNVNRFDDGRQLSFLGSGNNINKAGFSIMDYASFTGDMQRAMTGGPSAARSVMQNMNLNTGVPISDGTSNGYVNLWGAGLNYNEQFNKKTDINASYFFYDRNNYTDKVSTRSYFIPGHSDGFSQFMNINQSNSRITDNHRINLTVEHKIDSMNNLKFTGNYTNNAEKYNNSQVTVNKAADSTLINNANVNTLANQHYNALTTNLLFRHRFEKRGRFFTASAGFNLTDNNTSTGLNSRSYIASLNRQDSILQNQPAQSTRYDYDATMTYTEPLSRVFFLEGNYNFHLYKEDNDKKVYDIVNGEQTINDTLSNHFRDIYAYHRGGTNLRYASGDLQGTAGVSVQNSMLNANFLTTNTSVNRNWTYILPKAFIQYSMGFTKNIRFDYSTSINEPSVKQLQPVTSNTDPLNLYYGNPNLKPEYQHSLSAFYQSFNMKSGVHFFTALNTTYTLDKIQDARWTNSQYTSIYKPVNVPNDLTSSLMVNFGFRLQKPVLRMHFRANTSYSRSLAYINDVENRTNRYTTGGGVRLGYEIGDVFEIHTDARLNYNIAQYSVSSNLNSTYLNQIYSADMTIKLPWKLQIAGNSDFNIYNGATGFSSKNVFLVGAALSKFLFEKDRGELKLSVTDLLNQNTGIIRTTDVQYIENGYIRSLGRYIMLSFTYKVSAFPSGMKGMGPPGGPGMMRMMMGK